MSWRQLRSYVVGLSPEGTAIARAELGTKAIWTSSDHILALLADSVIDLHWAYLESHRDTKRRSEPLPRPKSLPRPGDRTAEPAKREPTVPEALRMLGIRVPPQPRE